MDNNEDMTLRFTTGIYAEYIVRRKVDGGEEDPDAFAVVFIIDRNETAGVRCTRCWIGLDIRKTHGVMKRHADKVHFSVQEPWVQS